MTDNFLEEVEGRLRSDRYRDLMVRAIPIAIGAVVLVVLLMLAAGGWQAYQHNRMNKTSETYAAAAQVAQGGDYPSADRRFGELAKSAPAAYKSMALMQQGALRLKQGKTAQAVGLFDQAAKADGDPLIADAARLKSALALMDTAPYAQIEARLKPLLDAKRPYRLPAREALAMAKLKTGMTRSARQDFVALANGLDTPETMRQRAQAALGLIDSGSAGVIAAALTAKPVMPPMPPQSSQPEADAQAAGPAGAVQPGAPQ